jgi:hypothetical protein
VLVIDAFCLVMYLSKSALAVIAWQNGQASMVSLGYQALHELRRPNCRSTCAWLGVLFEPLASSTKTWCSAYNEYGRQG